jgi:hypothetical protein
MADDTLDPTQLAQLGLGGITTAQANQAQLQAYMQVLKNLQGELGDYQKLSPGDYQKLEAQQLGPSALTNIQPNAQSRTDEQAAISQLGDIANSGGLELSDRNALNQLEQTLSRNNSARNNSLANQFAARGQLGSGNQLAMSLANNQNAAMNANQQGENIAADAQKRAMQAVMNKAAASRSMGLDDYNREKAAAEATDSINRFNAGMRTDAGKYNNSLAQQTYEDQLRKLQGETGVMGATNTALLGQGNQQAAGITGLGNIGVAGLGAIGKGLKGAGGGGGGGGSGDPNDPGLDQSGQSDLQGNRGGAADLSGGAAGTGNAADAAAGTGAGSDETDWAAFSGAV